MTRVAVIGLGTMGLPMARHLVDAGHDVVGCDVDPARVELLGRAGCGDAGGGGRGGGGGSPLAPDAGRGRGGRARRGRRAGRRRAGTLLVDMSTSPPALARRLASECAELDVLDAPVSGGPRGAEDATLTIMVGGDERAFRRALPLFEIARAPRRPRRSARRRPGGEALQQPDRGRDDGGDRRVVRDRDAGGDRPARALRARERVDRRLARAPDALPARRRRRRAPVLERLRAAVRARPDREGHGARARARRGARRRSPRSRGRPSPPIATRSATAAARSTTRRSTSASTRARRRVGSPETPHDGEGGAARWQIPSSSPRRSSSKAA